MEKKIWIVFVIILMSSLKGVNAATFSNYLPGGKNYLDENNFVLTNDSLSTINSFLVKGSTTYTISLPGTDQLGSNIFIEIYGDDLYIDGNIANDSNCSVDEQQSYCTFETLSTEDYIIITFGSDDLGNYVDYYGFTGFQLEEGSTPTSYEEYIVPFVDTSDPEFSGSGAYIKSYSTFESIESIIDNHLAVVDEVDGNITSNIIIESDLYSGNEQIVGEYSVELSASDSSGNIAYFNLTIIVKDEIGPVISGQPFVTYSVSDDIDLIDIINDTFTIEDEYSTATINILVDNYTVNRDIIGTYTVEFEAIDENQNSSSRTFTITLVDNEAPSVISSLNIDSYLSSPYHASSILNILEFSDNYTDMTNTNINVISNDFTGNDFTPGTYIINFEISDDSGNVLNTNLVINVIDDVNPQIGGPLTYQGSYTEELGVNDFLNMLTVSDNVDVVSLNDVYIIDDTYSNRLSSTGTYLVSFGIIDTNLNESTHTIAITIFDDVAPLIYIDNYIVTVDANSTFTTEDAVALLINSNEIDEGSYSVETLFDGYSGNEYIEGTYLYSLRFTNEIGDSYEKEFVVKVVNNDHDEVNESLIIRNLIMYSLSISMFGFIVYKNKK